MIVTALQCIKRLVGQVFCLIAVLSLFTAPTLMASEKPNILWITSEDNSSHWMGCYGNQQSRTPRIDPLAKEGILFENAYSNAPVCAVARATILMGAYATTMGTQHMRSRHVIPEKFRSYAEYLRKAGYYCTNHNKTDYNIKGKDQAHWDASSNTAHYKSRPSGKPFFAIFNLHQTHESSLFGNAPAEPQRIKPEAVTLPPYLPDLPQIRKDYARYLDRIEAMDKAVGNILDALEKDGLAEDTIVFYYSDHGGVLPRGKRYLEQTGVKVPMIIRIPKKFQHLTRFTPGSRVTEPISFVDLAPTVLSLAGIATPSQMQGRAFLGSHRKEPAAEEMEFLYADRFDELYGMRRGLTDGKWKYIRNFDPDLPNAPYSFYQFGQPCWQAYQKAFTDNQLSGYHKALWEAPNNSEQLYDLSADPWEMNNLAKNPAHAAKLADMRERLKAKMKETRDAGIAPEPLFETLAAESTIADAMQGPACDHGAVVDLAFVATEMDEKHLPVLKQALSSPNILLSYWATVGLRLLGPTASNEAEALMPLLKSPHAGIRTSAAQALYAIGKKDQATSALIADITQPMDAPSLLHLLNTLRRYELIHLLPDGWHKGKNFKQDGQDYIKRFMNLPAKNK